MELYVYNEIIKPIASYLDEHIRQATDIDLKTSVGLIDPNYAWSSKFSSWSEYDMLIVTPQSKGIAPATLALCYIDSSHRRAINISFNLSKPPTLHISCNLFCSRKSTSCLAMPMHMHYYDQANYASTFNWADRVLSTIENLFSDHRYYLWPEWSRLRTTIPIHTVEAIYSIDNIVKSIRNLGFP
jgi:hypothetical protein